MRPSYAVACAIVALAPSARAQDGPAIAPESRLHFSAAVEMTNAYFFRGILQQDQGTIVQPSFAVGIDVLRTDDATLTFSFGSWNSVHGDAGAASSSDDTVEHWYESDLYLSLTAAFGAWTVGATYTWYTSPADAFRTVNELAFTVGYDDSEHLGAWALNPSLVLAFETGSDFADGADSDRGIFLGISIAPGFSAPLSESLTLDVSFPATLGLSIDDYYQDGAGDDDTFGYASIGIRGDIALPLSPEWGAWTVYGSVTAIFLGDNLETVNNNDDVDLVAAIGVSLSF